MLVTDNKKQYERFVLNSILFVVYLLSFWMITESGYRCDDCYNANIIGTTYLTGTSIWDLTKAGIIGWLNNGRFFPFSGYTYLLFALLKTRWSYKFAILLFTYINSLLFGKLVKEISRSEQLQYLFMLLLPICIPLSCEYNSGLYSYHMLMHVVLLWLTLSMLFLLYYDKKKTWYWGLLGGLTFFLALGTYEIAFTFIIPMILLVWKWDKKESWRKTLWHSIKQCFNVLKYHFVIYAVVILINVWLRMQVVGQGYDGTSFNFNPVLIFEGFAKQVSGGIPLVRYVATVSENYGWKNEVLPLIQSIHWQQILLILLTCSGIYLIAKLKTDKLAKHQWFRLLLFGGCILCLPAGIIALSQKYQIEIQWGMGHLPAYIEVFGFTLIFVSIILLFFQQVTRKWLKMCLKVCIGLGIIFMLIVNQYMGWSTVKNDNLMYRYPRECVEEAIDCGILDSLSSVNKLITTTDYVMDYLGPELFYSKVSERAINAVNVNSLGDYEPVEGDYAIYTYANDNAGYCFIGECNSITSVENIQSETFDRRIYISQCLLYIEGEYDSSERTFQITTADEEKIEFNITDMKMKESNENGTLYECNFNSNCVDIKSLRVIE